MYVYYNSNPKRQQKQGGRYIRERESEQTCISNIAYFEIEFQDWNLKSKIPTTKTSLSNRS